MKYLNTSIITSPATEGYMVIWEHTDASGVLIDVTPEFYGSLYMAKQAIENRYYNGI